MYDDILDLLPYRSSFRFVDHISFLDMNEVRGDYALKKDAFFYADHFAGNPVTPGVILIEIMAQIGVVVLGIYLMQQTPQEIGAGMEGRCVPLLTSTEVSFHKMAMPGEVVTVRSKKQFFRFGKLKCQVEMHNGSGQLIANGTISGFIKKY
jgi:3-hydroxyacyl-[acyl-carrier-protein] dehydratase